MPKPIYSFLLTIFCSLLFTVSCTNQAESTKSLVINEQNKDSLAVLLEDKVMTGKDFQALYGYMMRKNLSGEEIETGKTIGELISTQWQWVADEELRQRKADSLAAIEREKERAIEEELLKSLDVIVTKKGFIEGNWETNRSFSDYITLKVSLKNNSSRAIKAFSGAIEWNSLMGESISKTGLSYPLGNEGTIAPGKTKRMDLTIDYNKFSDANERLKAMSLENMKVQWRPKKILFSDGTLLPPEEY